MIKAQDLVIDVTKTLGTNLLLTDISPTYKRENGKVTEEIEGFRYIVASEHLGLEKVGVKILGRQLIEKPEGLEKVVFEGLTLTAYIIDGKLVVSAIAAGISLKNKTSEAKIS